MINEFLWPELEDMDVEDLYLQQDSATFHTNGKTIGLSYVKSFQAEWFFETPIRIDRRDRAI